MDLKSLEIKIARSENLPVVPQLVSQILTLVDRSSVSSKMLEGIVLLDPAVTAKILRVANSPFHGLTGCTSVTRALSALGVNQLRSLVIGVAYQQAIVSRPHSALLDKYKFWQHSFAAGVATRILAKMRQSERSDELYDAGLLHDLGLLVMDRFCPDALDQAIQYAFDTRMNLHDAELVILGFNHCMVGGVLAQAWGFPPQLRSAMMRHHDVEKYDEFFEDTAMVVAGDVIAHKCGYGGPLEHENPEIPGSIVDHLDLSSEQIDVIKRVVIAEVTKAEETLAAMPLAA